MTYSLEDMCAHIEAFKEDSASSGNDGWHSFTELCWLALQFQQGNPLLAKEEGAVQYYESIIAHVRPPNMDLDVGLAARTPQPSVLLEELTQLIRTVNEGDIQADQVAIPAGKGS